MTAANPAHTPIAHSKTAAMSRVLDAVAKGYTCYTAGTCTSEKAERLAKKFHALYGIGCSPAQRVTRKKQGLANALLVMYWPAYPVQDFAPESAPVLSPELAPSAAPDSAPDSAPEIEPETSPDTLISKSGCNTPVSWLLLVSKGSGEVHEHETLGSVLETPRLVWLGYELVRHETRGKTAWTWRRTKSEMADLYAMLSMQINQRQESAVAHTLARISRQPGFSGVRGQSWSLCQFARQRGYVGALPFLYFVQKLSHGVPLCVSSD